MGLVSYHVIDKSGEKDNQGYTSYSITYEVITDTINDEPGNVALYVPGNVFTSTYPYDTLARLKKKSARQVGVKDNGGVWNVVLDFDSHPTDEGVTEDTGSPSSGDSGQNSAETPPDERLPTVDIDSVEIQEQLEKDYSVLHLPIRASNDQPFNPSLTVTKYHGLITISLFKAIANDSYSNMGVYVGHVNSNDWWGFAANTLLCKKYKLTTVYEHNTWWWQKQIVLEHKHDFWIPTYVLDCGTYQKYSMNDPPYKAFVDQSTGEKITEPIPLDGTGHRLAEGADPVYLEFQCYPTVSFTNIL